jgi:hypothetical protein
MLLLKLILVPGFIAVVTLAARRWGTRVGGLLMALPVVAGPTLAFYAIDQGRAFAAEAAEATLLGLVAVAGFCVIYARAAVRSRWPLSLLIGWSAFGVLTALLATTNLSLLASLGLALVALLTARWLIPRSLTAPAPIVRPKWDLPLRMAAAGTLVFVLTSIAGRLGPGWSGVLTPFPVVTAIFAAFTHAQAGRFLRGFIPGLCTFAGFCVVLSLALRTASLPLAFCAALSVQMALQAVILWRSLRESPKALQPSTIAELSTIGRTIT